MTILLVSDDDRGAFACQLLAQQLRQRGQACLTVGPALSSRRDSPLPAVTPQIPLSLMDLLGHELLTSASAVGVFIRRSDHLQRSAMPTASSPANVGNARHWCSAASASVTRRPPGARAQ